MTGYESKKAAAKAKVVVTDLDGHVVRGARKPKKVAALDKDAEIKRLNEKIEFLARANMLFSDWEHRDTQVTSELIRKGIEASKLNAELQAEIERLKEALAQPAQEPDWKALVLEHNADCDSRCDMDACGYKGHFEFSNRRCPTCPAKQKIDVNYSTQPAQEPYGYFQYDIRLDAWVQNRQNNRGVAFYTTPPQRQKVVFPTMLRKMWSGGEVQAWLDENVNKENT